MKIIFSCLVHATLNRLDEDLDRSYEDTISVSNYCYLHHCALD